MEIVFIYFKLYLHFFWILSNDWVVGALIPWGRTDVIVLMGSRHYIMDVLPWLIWGNLSDDTTTVSQKINTYRLK